MSEKTDQFREFKEWLERGMDEHKDAIEREPTVARPLHQAAEEARRRFKCVTEASPRNRVE